MTTPLTIPWPPFALFAEAKLSAGPTSIWLWLSVATAAALAIGAVRGYQRLRGTTLAAAALWGVAAAAALGLVPMLIAAGVVAEGSPQASWWRYGAAVGTCMPMMAVLGAKRPQDRGWQWVVVALWATMLAPVGQAIAAPSSGPLELFPAWRLMVASLILLGLLNYLPTTNAIAVLLAAAGQTLLLADYLVQLDAANQPARMLFGQSLILAGLVLALRSSVGTGIGMRGESSGEAAEASARWLAFRNQFGAFWALRIMQRVNQTAELAGWPVGLEWSGFSPSTHAGDSNLKGQITEEDFERINQSLDSILWRFEKTS